MTNAVAKMDGDLLIPQLLTECFVGAIYGMNVPDIVNKMKTMKKMTTPKDST